MSDRFQKGTCTFSIYPWQLYKVWETSSKRCERRWLHIVSTLSQGRYATRPKMSKRVYYHLMQVNFDRLISSSSINEKKSKFYQILLGDLYVVMINNCFMHLYIKGFHLKSSFVSFHLPRQVFSIRFKSNIKGNIFKVHDYF